MKSILGILLLLSLSLGAFAQGEVRRFNTLADLLAANPNGLATAGRATAVVSGNTNVLDGWSRVLAYSSSDTNAADNLTIFSPGSGVGRWRLLYLQNPTNSNLRAGIIPAWETNKFWANGAWVYLTNVFSFSAGSNVTVTPSATGVSISSTAAGSSLSFNGTSVSDPNITNSHAIRWTGTSSNYSAILTNYFYWEGIPIQFPSLRGGVYVDWSQSGSNLTPFIPAESLDPTRWEHLNWPTLMGRYSPSIGDIEYISVGANLNLDPVTGILSAVLGTTSTNGTPVSVESGGVLIEANFVDTSEIDIAASGTNISATLISGSIGTNRLSSAAASLLLDSHVVNGAIVLPFTLTNNLSDIGRLVFYTNANGHVQGYATNLGAATTTIGVNGTGVVAPNLANAAEVSFTTASGTNVYASLNAGSIALSKLANATAPALIGRAQAGSGSLETVSIGTGLNLATNGVLSATGTNLTTIRVDGTTVSGPNIQDSTELDWSVSGSTNVSASLFNSSVTLSKIQDISTSRLLGRSTSGSGSIEQILIGTGLSLSSGTLSATGGGGGGGTNASMVYVDGAAVSDPNFADSSTKFLFSVSGTNITGQLPGRDFGDITVGPAGDSMTIDADSVALGTDTTGNYIATVAGTSSEISVSGSGSETAAVTLSLPATIDLGGKTSFEIPNGTSPVTDAFGEIAGDSDAWASGRGAIQAFDGTANTLLVGALASDTPSNGQVPKWNTGGTITWEDDAGSGGAGTVVTVDGGSDLARANFADASTTGLFDISGTNITFRLPDRDFGDIMVGSSGAGMTVDADSVALGTDTTGNYVATIAGTANEISVSGSGSESAAVTLSLPATIDLGGKTSFELPNGASPTTDATGEIAVDDNAWATGRGAAQLFDGTANTYLVGALASDTPSNGQVPTWNTGGTITWETPSAGGGSSTNILVNGTLVTSANLVDSSSIRFDVSGSSISAVVTNAYADGHYAGGFLPLFAGQSNALTGDLHFKQGSDIRVPMWESGTDKNAIGLRANNGVLGLSEFNTNDFTILETFLTVDPTGSGDVITFGNSGFDNSVVFEADVNFSGGLAAGTISVNDDAYAAGWDGSTNVPTKNAVYDKIQSLSSGSNQWDEWDSWAIRRWEFGGNSSALGLEPGLAFTAISSGTGGTTVGLSTFDGHNAFYVRTATGAATSTGGWVNEGVNTRYLTARANQLKFEFSANRTNGAVYGLGYSDSTTTSEATDALRLIMTNDVICGIALSNNIKAVTASTFQIQQAVEYRGFILQTNDYAHFQVYSNVPGSSAVLVWEDVIATGIPLGSSRLLSVSFGGFNTHTSVTNGTDFLYINRALERTAQ